MTITTKSIIHCIRHPPNTTTTMMSPITTKMSMIQRITWPKLSSNRRKLRINSSRLVPQVLHNRQLGLSRSLLAMATIHQALPPKMDNNIPPRTIPHAIPKCPSPKCTPDKRIFRLMSLLPSHPVKKWSLIRREMMDLDR